LPSRLRSGRGGRLFRRACRRLFYRSFRPALRGGRFLADRLFAVADFFCAGWPVLVRVFAAFGFATFDVFFVTFFAVLAFFAVVFRFFLRFACAMAFCLFLLRTPPKHSRPRRQCPTGRPAKTKAP
jgi:hypothetical protein